MQPLPPILMEIYKLTIIRQSRALMVVPIFCLSIVGAIFFAKAIDNILLKMIIPLFALMLINFLAVYSSFSILTIQIDNKKLKFYWTPKLIFNFPAIEEIHIDDINTLVIDLTENKEILHSITTNSRKIKLGMATYWRKDADDFICYLKANTNARTIDSWDVLKEKGFLSIFYYITFSVLLTASGIITWIIVDKGINKLEIHELILFIGSYLTLIPYYVIMKSKMNKNRW